MEALVYTPPTDRTRANGINAITGERQNRKEMILKAAKYYAGDHPNSLIVEDGVDDNVIVNLPKQSVDRTVAFLFPKSPHFQLTDDYQSDAELYLADTFIRNGGTSFFVQLAKTGALAGHVYVRVFPKTQQRDYVRLQVINPENIITYWNAADYEEVLWHEIYYKIDKQERVQDFVNRGTYWEIIDYMRVRGGKWEQVSLVRWNTPFPPIINWRHLIELNQFYGRGEFSEDNFHLIHSVNRVASDISRILRFHAFPRTVATGISAEEITGTAIDGLYVVENADATIKNLEMESDLQSSMNFLDYLTRVYFSQNRVVQLEGDVRAFQRVTTASIRAVFLDQIAKNQELRHTYGRGIQQLCMTLLAIEAFDTSVEPTIVWSDPLPSDEGEIVNRLAVERNMNIISRREAAEVMGREWKETLQLLEEESKIEFLQDSNGVRQGQTETNRISV